MEQLIKKIIDIENDAQDIVKAAQEARDRFDQDIAGKVAALQEGIALEADKKITQMEALEADLAKQRTEEIKNEIVRKSKEFDALYEKNRQAWADQIFENILRR